MTTMIELACGADPHLHVAGRCPNRSATDAHVLLVDDDDDYRGILAAALKAMGFDVEEASNGADAFEKALARVPCAIVTDFAMPRVDGGQLVHLLAQDPRARATPVMLISAMPDMIPLDVRLGCAAVLAKPCSPEVVAGMLRML